MLGGQPVPPGLGLVLDDTPGRHHAEPLAHVALVEARRVGELLARRGACLGERVEETGAVTDRDHHGDGGAVQRVQHAPGERFGAIGVVDTLEHRHLLWSGL